jgi:hypothetical protein
MKIVKQLIAILAISYAVTVLAYADTDLSTFTQAQGMATIQAGDTMGLEVIPRAELESVRGEALPLVVVAALGTISYYGLVYGVPFALNYAAGLSSGSWYVSNHIKNQVKSYFGW